MPSRVLRRFGARLRVHRLRAPSSRITVAVLLIAVLISVVGAVFVARVKPIVAVLAKAEAREYVVRAINDAVETEVSGGKLRYGELVTLEKDSNGAITALVTDMAKINVLQSRISNQVATNIVNVISSKMSVPLGDAVGGILFAGRGPRVPIKVESVTDVRTQFVNDFSSGGINQTRHKITLSVTADIVILIPGGRTSAVVASDVAVAETVIVGNVPNVYANNNP
ncbi:MAG: sporulation protein YunB [Oscillospiraceae bacterium]|nr:sporulation protein YunB [Oscillospiraceae bacterium]